MRKGSGDQSDSQWRVEESAFLLVIPGPDEDRPVRGGMLRLLSIELYGEGIVLTYLGHSYAATAHEEALTALRKQPDFMKRVQQSLAAERKQRAEIPHATYVPDEWAGIAWQVENDVREWLMPTPVARDDRGNLYLPLHGFHAGTTQYRSTYTLRPGVHPDARQITVRFGEDTFTVPIPARLSSAPETRHE